MALLETFLTDFNNLSSSVGESKSSSREKVPDIAKKEEAEKKEESKEEQERSSKPQSAMTGGSSHQGGRSGLNAPRPLQAYYKGEHRGIHDGGGLKSPGRLPVDQRPPPGSQKAADLGAHCKKLFLRWLLEKEAEKKGSTEAAFWNLAAGRLQSSPFGSRMGDLRDRLDEMLVEQGFEPQRKETDRDTEINFRRLRAVLQSLGDEDHCYLDEMASSGVSLGVDETMPRTPEVFEEKTKWAREFTDEVLEDKMADNYPSAEESWEDIKRQVMEDVERGCIIEMEESEAVKEFSGRLAVAALGAVPKDQESTAVRLIHDGSYSVDVNRRIKVRDRLRFPLIDDAAAMLVEAERMSRGRDGPQRMSMVYDISRAHKLIPIRRKDWGLQAFRLPGRSEDQAKKKIYLHTRGTFGIASAAYWWGRVAAGLVRAAHKLSDVNLGVLHLLFADDGWVVATGKYFWRKLLYWLFILELLEVPISWKKVKAGTTVQWIGYTLCVQTFRKGIAERKVRWVEDWVRRHLASGGATGREVKAALGRLTFVAGALQMLRPFLGPLFAWSAILRGGAFAKFPEAVHMLLKFIERCVREEPMTVARSVAFSAEEVFRVDAKAEKDKIVIGGWESFGVSNTKEARWFSVELTRRNAAWAYVKGEPFRAIASLELTAILTALILFGKGAKWTGRRTKLQITGITDNLGNAFLVHKFLSCKFPLSIILMEVSCQLRRLNLEMDLGWVPRDQNTQADALTNSSFEDFDESRRIVVNFENIEFMVLRELMAEAGKLDEDIRLVKSSKEAKQDKFARERSPKQRRGEMKWRDPW